MPYRLRYAYTACASSSSSDVCSGLRACPGCHKGSSVPHRDRITACYKQCPLHDYSEETSDPTAVPLAVFLHQGCKHM